MMGSVGCVMKRYSILTGLTGCFGEKCERHEKAGIVFLKLIESGIQTVYFRPIAEKHFHPECKVHLEISASQTLIRIQIERQIVSQIVFRDSSNGRSMPSSSETELLFYPN